FRSPRPPVGGRRRPRPSWPATAGTGSSRRRTTNRRPPSRRAPRRAGGRSRWQRRPEGPDGFRSTHTEVPVSEQYWVGVDLGGTKTLAGLFDESFKLVGRAKEPTPRE